jgi:hypothetical protein
MWSASYHLTEETSRFILSTGVLAGLRAKLRNGSVAPIRDRPLCQTPRTLYLFHATGSVAARVGNLEDRFPPFREAPYFAVS